MTHNGVAQAPDDDKADVSFDQYRSRIERLNAEIGALLLERDEALGACIKAYNLCRGCLDRFVLRAVPAGQTHCTVCNDITNDILITKSC